MRDRCKKKGRGGKNCVELMFIIHMNDENMLVYS